jgi:hypothetical protein
LFAHVEVDQFGNVIPNSTSRMKFVGKTPEQFSQKIFSKKYDKYINGDVSLEISSDFYEGVQDVFESKN